MIPNTGEKSRYIDEARARCSKGPIPDFSQKEILDILNEIEWRGERIIELKQEMGRHAAQYNDRELRLHEEMAAVRRELDDARKATIRLLQLLSCSLNQEIPNIAVVPARYSEMPWTVSDPKRRPHQPQATPPPAVPDPACSRCHGAGAIQCSCQQVTEGIRGHSANQVELDELKDRLVEAGWTKSTSEAGWTKSTSNDRWENGVRSLLDPYAFESSLHHGLVRPELLPNRIATPQLCAAVIHANHLAAKLRECIQCARSNFGELDAELVVYLNGFEREVFGDIAYADSDMGEPSPCEPEPPPAPWACSTCGGSGFSRLPSATDKGEACLDCIPF